MIEYPTDFCYLGDRNYLHGTTVLIAGLALLEANTDAPLLLKRLRFLKEVAGNGRILLSRDPGLTARFKTSAWHLTCKSNEENWRAVFVEENRPVNCRDQVQYQIGDLRSDGAYGGQCEIAPQGRDDLIRVLVEANKRFHLVSLPDSEQVPQVRFGYLENWRIPPADIAFTGKLMVKNLATHQAGGSFSTINRLEYQPTSGRPESMTICFEVSEIQRGSA